MLSSCYASEHSVIFIKQTRSFKKPKMSKSHSILSRVKRHAHWGYTGPHGPDHWEGLCQIGQRQSPINIIVNNTKEISFPPFGLGDDYNNYLNLEAENNGHTLVVTIQNNTFLPTIHGGGLVGKYVFKQLHFHWGSEHQIDGERAALEIHLVHYNSKYDDFETACHENDGLAVIAVLCDEVEDSDSQLEEFLRSALRNVDYKLDLSKLHLDQQGIDKITKFKKNYGYEMSFKLRDFLPEDISSWFRYEGSLTTPNCNEYVTWTILRNRLKVASGTIDTLKKLKDKTGNELHVTYRPIQDLNGRTVFIQFDESDNELVTDEDKTKKNLSQLILPNPMTLAYAFIVYAIFNIKYLNTNFS